MTSLRRLAPVCASLLLLAACGASDDGAADRTAENATPADSAPADPSASSGPVIDTDTADPADPADPGVPAALQFTAPAVGGGEIDAATYAGTPTVFWFWAPT